MTGLAGAPGATMSGGMADVASRVAQIQQRIASLRGPAAAAGPAATPSGQGQPAFDLAAAKAALDGRLAPASTSRPATGTSPSAPPDVGAAATRLASKLPAQGRAWAPAITDAALRVGLEPALLAALVRHESDFDPGVVSHAGAIGLAQLMPGTAAGLGVDPHDPLENLAGGARYLRDQLDRFGSVDLALAAYNAGPNRVAQAGGVPRIAETTAYVGRVISTWEQLR